MTYLKNDLKEIFNSNDLEISNLEEFIYEKYSNSKNTASKVPLRLKISKKMIQKTHIDKGWVLKGYNSSYLSQLNKFLVFKAGQSVLVNSEDFLINQNNSNSTTKYVDIYQKAYFEAEGWHWFTSADYLNFQNIVRLYFTFKINSPSPIRSFIKDLIEILNIKKIPFQFKVEVELSNRYENAVLYFQKEHYFLVFLAVRYLHIEKIKIFRSEKPMFTYNTGMNGISFAEDPNEPGVSFGQKRSKLLAEVYSENHNSIGKQLNAIRKKGYNIKQFFRNPGENYPYAFKIFDKNILKDDYFSNFSLIEKRYKSNTNLAFAIELSKFILKNAIFKDSKNGINVDWLIGEKDTFLPSNVIYRICTISEKLEVLYFLSKLYVKSVNDGLLKTTCQIGLNSINENGLLDEDKFIYSEIKENLSNGVGNPDFEKTIKSLSNNKDFQSTLNKIIAEFKKRGVLTWQPDDAFDPTYSKFGYSYIGLTILIQSDKE